MSNVQIILVVLATTVGPVTAALLGFFVGAELRERRWRK